MDENKIASELVRIARELVSRRAIDGMHEVDPEFKVRGNKVEITWNLVIRPDFWRHFRKENRRQVEALMKRAYQGPWSVIPNNLNRRKWPSQVDDPITWEVVQEPKVTITGGEIYAKAIVEYLGDDKSEMNKDIKRAISGRFL
jgi:hypothetical protein